MEEHVIFAIHETNDRMRVGALPADKSPLPFGAEMITRVVGADLNMMLLWAKRRAKRGWSVEKMREACD
jgi:hypothetical protein